MKSQEIPRKNVSKKYCEKIKPNFDFLHEKVRGVRGSENFEKNTIKIL